jgi:hypothetical protein
MSENRILNFRLLYVSFEKLIVDFWDFIVLLLRDCQGVNTETKVKSIIYVISTYT